MSSRKNQKLLAKQERIIIAYQLAATKILPLTMGATRCLNSSRVTIDTLARFGLTSAPVSVHAVFMNQQWYDLMKANGGYPKDAEERDRWVALDGYCIGIDTDKPQDENSYPGHVIVAVPEVRCLIDAASAQFNRPDHGLEVPEVLAIPLTSKAKMHSFLTGKEQAVMGSGVGSYAFYNARLEDKAYEYASGFQPHDGNRESTDVIEAYMRKLLTSYPVSI